MSTRDLNRALRHDLEQIRDNVALYRSGRDSAYQGVAIQLRNLLLKGRRGLFSRVIPDATFHRLRTPHVPPPAPPAAIVSQLDPRGTLVMSPSNGFSIELGFTDELIPLQEWLEQWILMPEITIRRLIEHTTNEEVAHTEDAIGDLIQRADSWTLTSSNREQKLHEVAVVSVGDYVENRTRELLGMQQPS